MHAFDEGDSIVVQSLVGSQLDEDTAAKIIAFFNMHHSGRPE
jgi:hypothetical protein